MSTQHAYKGEITLAFDYKSSVNSSVQREYIASERIKYLMIEYLYENVNILPVVYVSIWIDSDMYTKIVNSNETSKFYLKVKKYDALSQNAISNKVIEDTFTYVVSTTNNNYADNLNINALDPYKGIMIGLVSEEMTNKLRKTYNGIYQKIDQNALVQLATEKLGKIVMAPLKYNKAYPEFVIPPITSRYKLLNYLFENDPFYDSMFTFFMDFDKTYLIPKNGNPVDGKDGIPSTVIINIKNYDAAEAMTDGYTIENGAYVVYVNGINTNTTINNSTSKVSNNIVGYWDSYPTTQDLNIDNNNTEGNEIKTMFARSNNAAGIRNEIESDSVIVELLKQNLDGDIFEPNRSYRVSNYGKYSKYDGLYFLMYKREFYSLTSGEEFLINSNIGLKKAAVEETARAITNELRRTTLAVTSTGNTTSSKTKRNSLKSVSASRAAKKTGYVK